MFPFVHSNKSQILTPETSQFILSKSKHALAWKCHFTLVPLLYIQIQIYVVDLSICCVHSWRKGKFIFLLQSKLRLRFPWSIFMLAVTKTTCVQHILDRERAKKKSTPLSHALIWTWLVFIWKQFHLARHITEEFFSSQVSDVSRVLEVLYASRDINRDG